ncbi:hypothetical protein [Methylocucumis oryzae]|uniref:Uncharacterized protein n=1 Tax=Methylocucumis oryzae TaxID=1632867 RepID=A0A0F3IGF0_9GAMM|nr:hypothetical protein [Methylocucumis oryzae]KJV05831.1 hypothetical protein VZ94_15345 [Methylocucumis oryzae]
MEKYNLYQDQKKKLATYELVELFKENTHIGMVNANLVNQGKNNKAAIAFNISWSDKSPELAQRVTNELVTLFLDENVRARTQRAEETTAFLAEEVDKLKNEIQKIETAIAEYKQKYSSSLPELLPVNLSAINRLETELQQLDLKERMLSERRIGLNAQMLAAGPTLAAAPALRNDGKGPTVGSIEELQATESSLLSKYSSSHPDVLQIRRQIEILKNNKSSPNDSTELVEAKK